MVSASLDAHQIYSDTPNANNGLCVAHGTLSGTGALEFDAAQPCPEQTAVSVPIDVSKLKNGRHELDVSVTDAAGNVATVFDQEISVANPKTTRSSISTPKKTRQRAVRVKVDFTWVWRATHTKLSRITFHTLPHHSTVSLACSGRGCPRNLGTTSRKLALKTLEARAARDTFLDGQKLTLTIARRGDSPERIRVTVRNGEAPALKLL
jgi:hypothetical protein